MTSTDTAPAPPTPADAEALTAVTRAHVAATCEEPVDAVGETR